MARPLYPTLSESGRIFRWSTPLLGVPVVALALIAGAPPAQALSMKECSAKYHDAKTAGTLNGADWKAFRASQCTSNAGAAAAPAAAATPAVAAPATVAPPAPVTAPAPAPSKSASAKAATPAPAPNGAAPVLPSAVSPKYATETAGKARMHTCLDQYNANKETGGNEGLKWIEKGGGYYSECTKHLKG